ncbi:MAG: type I methionyl aminopeptidase [Clostridia bacterium]|nr:type I methionyl aminopeptidase [Clostridia bacterium]
MIVLKTARELALMREACRISAGALRVAGEAVRPGISTWEIDKIAYEYIKKQGAEPNFLNLYGFPATACISINDEVIHGIPSKKRILREGDIVSIDLGAKINGFNGDNAATFACGKISDEAQRLIDATKESLYEAIKVAVVGNKIGDIASTVQNYCETRGYSVVREYTGHGVGKELHEDPSVPNYGKAGRGVRLVAGMTLAIEPMINLGTAAIKVLPDGWTVKTRDSKLSAHFEHTIAITPGGPVILTQE